MDFKKGTANRLAFSRIYVGAGWNTSGGGQKGITGWAKRKKGVDLDFAAVGFSADGEPKIVCWFDNKDPFENGALLLDKDNTTGKGSGDDENITADLAAVAKEGIVSLVFVLTAFKDGVDVSKVESVKCRIVDNATGKEEGMFRPTLNVTTGAVAMFKVELDADGSWYATEIDRRGTARTRQGIINIAHSARN